MSDRGWLRDAVHMNLLGAANRPAIICEGPDDSLFLTTMAQLFKVDLTDFIIIPTHGKTPQIKLALELLKNLSNKERNVAILVDRDFRLSPEKDSVYGELVTCSAKVFCWSMPAIESYLFVHLCFRGKLDLSKLKEDEAAKKITTAFFNSFASQNSTNPCCQIFWEMLSFASKGLETLRSCK